jgi:hypothetical protein
MVVIIRDLVPSLASFAILPVEILKIILRHPGMVGTITVLQTWNLASCLALTPECIIFGIQEIAFCRRIMTILNIICTHDRQLCIHMSQWHLPTSTLSDEVGMN